MYNSYSFFYTFA